MKQIIRIIGGLYRGKKIAFPESQGLRPTPDRVRETLFNWLMHDIRGARCLDAFAGSGALGLEAFSRGAEKVEFVEHSPAVFAHLKKTVTSFQSKAVEVIKANALDYLQQSKKTYDIIFLDPPYALDLLPQCLQIIYDNNLLSTKGLIYIESPNEIAMDLTQWEQIKAKKAGVIFYGLLKRAQTTA